MMRRRGLKKTTLVVILIAIGVISSFVVLLSLGVIKLETFGSDSQTIRLAHSVEELEDGCYYIWHSEENIGIRESLNKADSNYVFQKCPTGDINWDENGSVNHIIWFTSSNDIEIPTLYPGDELIYVSSTYVPYEGIAWEHFADYGYSIGIANLKKSNSGHYWISNNGEGDYSGYIYENSDAIELSRYVNVKNLFIDKIGSTKVKDSLVTESGTLFGLEKDKSYVCEWYTGTYYQDYEMKADVHVYGSMETFKTYEFDFLHSRCIAVSIPEWFPTGYYFVDGIGFFRYVKGADANEYNGEPYDANIEWNTKIIIRDQNGLIQYDPSTGINNISTNDSTTSNQQNNINDSYQDIQSETNEDLQTDAGAEEYEDITNEIVIP